MVLTNLESRFNLYDVHETYIVVTVITNGLFSDYLHTKDLTLKGEKHTDAFCSLKLLFRLINHP